MFTLGEINKRASAEPASGSWAASMSERISTASGVLEIVSTPTSVAGIPKVTKLL